VVHLLAVATPPPNKRLQLTPNSSFQSIRGTLLAAGVVPQRWRSALLGAADPLGGRNSQVQPLPYESLLQTLAELSVAFIGFSMLASVLRGSRGDEHLRFMDFRDVAEIGLFAAVGSLTPQLLQAFGLSTESTWRAASGLLGGLYTAGFLLAGRRRPVSVSRLFVRFPISTPVVTACMLAIAVLSIANVLFPSIYSGARHLLAVVLTLVVAALLFMRAAFNPDISDPAAQQGVEPDVE